MNPTVLESLLLHARHLELRSQRIFWIVMFFLGLVHAALVTPYIAASQRRASAESNLRNLQDETAALAGIEEELRRSDEVLEEVMTPALEELISGVAEDLGRLRATNRSLRDFVARERGSEDLAAPDNPARDGDEADRSDPDVEVEPFRVENIDRILAIGEAETREQTLAALAPLVEERITHPRFSDLQQRWKAEVRPRIEASLEGAAAQVPSLRHRLREIDEATGALFRVLGESLSAQKQTVSDLTWAPPERQDWWSAVEPPVGEMVATTLDAAVMEQLRHPLALDQLESMSAKTAAAFQKIAASVAQRKEELSREVNSSRWPEGWALPGLGNLIPAFPLILGLTLAAFWTGRSRRRRETGLVTYLLAVKSDASWLRDWYFLRSCWGLTLEPTPYAEVAAWRCERGRILAFGFLILAWIGVVAAQLRALGPDPFQLFGAAVGSVAFLLAIGYDWVVARRLNLLLGEASETSETRISDEDRAPEDEALEGHDLRR